MHKQFTAVFRMAHYPCVAVLDTERTKTAEFDQKEFEKRLDKKLRYTTIIRGDGTVIHPGK